MFDVITIGDTKLDTFVVLNDASVQCSLQMPECQLCLEYGAKIPVRVVDTQIAGTAPNVAVGLSRLGKKTAVVSLLGHDHTRLLAEHHLRAERVSTRYLKVHRDDASPFAVVINYKGERTMLTSTTRCAVRLPTDISTRWLYVGETGTGYETLFRQIRSSVRQNNISLGFNPGIVQLKEQKPILFDLVRETDVLFVNREEGGLLTRQTKAEIKPLAAALKKLGARQIVITDGANGAYHFDGKTLLFCPVFPVKVIEKTGAGDAFATGFLAALLSQKSNAEALRWGMAESASVVEHVGPQPGLLNASALAKRLANNQKIKPMIV